MSASIQDTYTRPRGFLGGIVSSKPVRSLPVKSLVATQRGKFVKLDANGDATALTAVADVVAGVIMRENAMTPEAVAIGDEMLLCKEGDIIVYCDKPAVKGLPVFARCIANGAVVGDATIDVDFTTVNNAVQINAVFAETTTVAGLVAITPNLV